MTIKIDDRVLDEGNRNDPVIIAPNGRTLFVRNELACRGTGIIKLAPGFAQTLMILRLELDLPINPSSVCRSLAHNQAVRGHPRSLHVYDKPHWPTGGTCAIDCRTRDVAYRARIVECMLDLGWSVGVHGQFIHGDRRTEYVSMRKGLFLY